VVKERRGEKRKKKRISGNFRYRKKQHASVNAVPSQPSIRKPQPVAGIANSC
jgi:hypothetical protein